MHTRTHTHTFKSNLQLLTTLSDYHHAHIHPHLKASAYSTYRYAKYHRSAADLVSNSSSEASDKGQAFSVFDSLASAYDDAIGSEETW